MRRILRKVLGGPKPVSAGPQLPEPGHVTRPIGQMHSFLGDIKARGFECGNVLDIGAHMATWSTTCASIYPNAKYHMLEPQAEMEEHLQQFCSQYPGSQYLMKGAGEKPSEKVLTVWEDRQGSSFVPEEINLELGMEKRKLEITTIDSLVDEGWLPVPDIVKVDVQGYEHKVIEGAGRILGKTEVIILETSLYNFLQMPDLSETVAFMKERGYLLYDIAGYNRRPYDGALAQVDLVFARQDGILRAFKNWSE